MFGTMFLLNKFIYIHAYITNIITLVMYGAVHMSFYIFKYFYDAFLGQVFLVKDT